MVAMPSHLQRALVIPLMVALLNNGCYAPHYQRLEPNTSLDDASGITTRSGEELGFAVDGATITNDTLRARGKVAELKVPTDSVAQVRSRRFSPWRTGALIVGVAAAAFAALVVTTCCSFDIP
jgi:hypothetical protein